MILSKDCSKATELMEFKSFGESNEQYRERTIGHASGNENI